MAQTDEVTGATETPEAVTAQAEEPGSPGSESQDSTTKLEEFETRLRELEERATREATARAEAERKAEEAEARAKKASEEREEQSRIYKGLQTETNRKTARLSQLEKEVESRATTDARLEKIEALIEELFKQNIDPERLTEINAKLQNEQIRRENERLKLEAQAQQQSQQRPQLTNEVKKQLYDVYFKAEFPNVDPLDLTFEQWHTLDSHNDEEWKFNVRQEFVRLAQKTVKQPDTATLVDEITQRLQAQWATQLEAIQAENAAKYNEAAAKAKALEEQLAAAERKSEEQLARAKGRDREDTTSVSPSPTKTNQKLAAIPDDWLYGTPDQRKAYHDAMNNKALRDQILGIS